MANNFFKFKQFTIFQNDEVLKVSTDSVLLGAWVPLAHYKKILDIGTGTGLLSLMLAQRFSQAYIDAVEIDSIAYQVAKENFRLSPFAERINLFHESIQNFTTQNNGNRYDLIVTNPPYFNNQKPAATIGKNIQKHGSCLSYDELAETARSLLTMDGVMAFVFPQEEAQHFITTARFYGLFCSRITEVYIRHNQKKPKRMLLLLSKTLGNVITEKLYLENNNNQPSSEYLSLTDDFYL